MQSNQVEIFGIDNTRNGCPGLTVFKIKPEPIPFRVNAGIHIHTDSNPGFQVIFLAEFDQRIKFVEMIDMDQRIVAGSSNKLFVGFIGSVKNNFIPGDTITQRFFVFKTRHHFGPGAFLVKNAANGIKVIGFIRPGKLNFWITCFKNPRRVLIIAPDLFLRNNK